MRDISIDVSSPDIPVKALATKTEKHDLLGSIPASIADKISSLAKVFSVLCAADMQHLTVVTR